MNRNLNLVAYFFSILCNFSTALNNGLALTPPMGWLTWQRYRCIVDCENYPNDCISEKLFKNVADLLINEGYQDVGYEYIIIDDCWMDKNRTIDGKLQADRSRFPKGLKHLSNYIHSKGLKFGIYEDYGTRTCEGYPGIINSMKTDAQTFSDWEVDYVKIDACNSDTTTLDFGFTQFGHLLNQTRRPMVYSCSWPAYQQFNNIKTRYTDLVKYCNLWRSYEDVQDSWQSISNIMEYFALKQDFWNQYTGPGHWNDPDMLIIGNYGLSYDQSKVQMAIWAVLAAPLIISTDLRTIKPEFKKILQNRAIIKVNQDRLGIPGKRIQMHSNGISVWTRPISPLIDEKFSYAIAFVSKRTFGAPYLFRITLEDMALYNPSGYRFYDLFEEPLTENKSFVLQPKQILEIRINPSGVVFYRADVIPN